MKDLSEEEYWAFEKLSRKWLIGRMRFWSIFSIGYLFGAISVMITIYLMKGD